MDELTQLTIALTPLLTGPTAGLVTVLILVALLGAIAYYQVFPIVSRSWERQARSMEQVAASLILVQSTLDSMSKENSFRFAQLENEMVDIRRMAAGAASAEAAKKKT